MADLSNLDLIFVFAYFIVLILIGYFSSRKQKEEDYLIAERKLGTLSTMMTLNASKTGSILMLFVAMVYLWGISALWYFIGAATGLMIFVPFALKLKEESKTKYYTLADYFRYNYGETIALIASFITIFIMFGFLVINLIAGTKIFVFFTGWPFWICAGIMIVVVLSYILMAGFKAVVKTDVLQYIAIIIILAFLAFILFDGSLIPASEWNFFNAELSTIIGFFMIGLLMPFASPEIWQRVYSSKGKKELRNGMILSVIIYTCVAFLLALVALTVKIQFPDLDPDLALIYGFANLLPGGLLGLSVILLFAAIMSTIDTYIFAGSSAIVQDFFNYNRKKTVSYIKKTIFLFTVLAAIVAVLIQDLVIGGYIFVSIVVVLAICVLATWIKKNIKQRTLLFELVIGVIGLMTYMIISLSKGQIQPTIVIVALGSSIIGLIIGGIVSYLKDNFWVKRSDKIERR
ncbi:hypothetical protein CMI39_02505 [Candidatus Pacearchaeota archaeon]|nr:hypothetical protein [Candidatus Pacearchaeota archaeon]